MCSQIITPFNVYFNPRYIYQKMELWRLVTNFLYFGNLGPLALPLVCTSAALLPRNPAHAAEYQSHACFTIAVAQPPAAPQRASRCNPFAIKHVATCRLRLHACACVLLQALTLCSHVITCN
jgi:hypothetical protein